jgi:hypothetical protein
MSSLEQALALILAAHAQTISVAKSPGPYTSR